MYFKIALNNVKKSMKDYSVYFLTLMFGICLFYMFNSIHSQQAVLNINKDQKAIMDLMTTMINGISVFIAVILAFLIIYANQFLMKRRHKEMGIYLMLGMEKSKVSRILVIETFLIGLIALVTGLVIGVFASQGLSMVTAKLFAVEMKKYQFVFSRAAFLQTIGYFVLIFVIVMIFNGIIISKYKLIDLLNSARKNQKLKVKKLWVSVVLFLMSIGFLAAAYYLIRKNGLLGVDHEFTMSIIFGVIGTFLFFLSLSGFLLRVVQSNKNLYYRGLNMFVLRQINAKITTTFVSMTMLCLMLFLAISAFATGTGMTSALNDTLERMTKFDYSFYDYEVPQKDFDDPLYLVRRLEKHGVKIQENAKDIIRVNLYENKEDAADPVIYKQLFEGNEAGSKLSKKQREKYKKNRIAFTKLSEYNRARKLSGEKEIKLKKNQYIINCTYTQVTSIYENAIKNQTGLKINGKTYRPYKGVQETSYTTAAMATDGGTIIVPDEVIDAMDDMMVSISYTNINWKKSVGHYSDKIDELTDGKGYYVGTALSKDQAYQQSTGLRAVVTYIAIYIGIVFLITSAAVLALQQLSENADNLQKYQLFQKLGVDNRMISKSVRTQVIIYFMIPVSLAVVHSFVGISVATNVIQALGNMDIFRSVMQTVFVMLIIYGGYMFATYLGSKAMLKIKE